MIRLYFVEGVLDRLVVYKNEETVRGNGRKRMRGSCMTLESRRRHALNKMSLANSISNSSDWSRESVPIEPKSSLARY